MQIIGPHQEQRQALTSLLTISKAMRLQGAGAEGMVLAGAAQHEGWELKGARGGPAFERCERGPNVKGRALTNPQPGSPKSVAARRLARSPPMRDGKVRRFCPSLGEARLRQ